MRFPVRQLMENARVDGVDIPTGVTYEQMRDFVERDAYKIQIPRESNIQLELGILKDIIKLLYNRKWSLFTPDNPDSHFVSCDHPVVLS